MKYDLAFNNKDKSNVYFYIIQSLFKDVKAKSYLLNEYEDYRATPTRAAASEFITRAIEDNYDLIAKRENYVSYIAQRPRVDRAGSHGLFNGTDNPLALSKIAEEVAVRPSAGQRDGRTRSGWEKTSFWA